MSKYAYCEFIAIDGALTDAELAEVRTFSARTTIVPTCFVGVCN